MPFANFPFSWLVLFSSLLVFLVCFRPFPLYCILFLLALFCFLFLPTSTHNPSFHCRVSVSLLLFKTQLLDPNFFFTLFPFTFFLAHFTECFFFPSYYSLTNSLPGQTFFLSLFSFTFLLTSELDIFLFLFFHIFLDFTECCFPSLYYYYYLTNALLDQTFFSLFFRILTSELDTFFLSFLSHFSWLTSSPNIAFSFSSYYDLTNSLRGQTFFFLFFHIFSRFTSRTDVFFLFLFSFYKLTSFLILFFFSWLTSRMAVFFYFPFTNSLLSFIFFFLAHF